jgi:hypothetical protein
MNVYEEQAWDVLMVCQNQPLVSPMGGVVGLDLHLAMQVAQAKSYNVAVVIEFMAEANQIYIQSKTDIESKDSE